MCLNFEHATFDNDKKKRTFLLIVTKLRLVFATLHFG